MNGIVTARTMLTTYQCVGRTAGRALGSLVRVVRTSHKRVRFEGVPQRNPENERCIGKHEGKKISERVARFL